MRLTELGEAEASRRRAGRPRRLVLAAAAVVLGASVAGAVVAASAHAALPAPRCRFDGLAPGATLERAAPGAEVEVRCADLVPGSAYALALASPLYAVAVAPDLPSREVDLETALEGDGVGRSAPDGMLVLRFLVPPVFAALDPAASCPPSAAQLDAGLTSCSLSLFSLPRGVTGLRGSAPLLLPVVGQGVFLPSPGEPAAPTLVLSTGDAVPGGTVAVHDVELSAARWWGETLRLPGEPVSPWAVPPADIDVGLHPVASSFVRISPARWDGSTLVPPLLSGSFVVPRVAPGPYAVTMFEPDATPVAGNATGDLRAGELTATSPVPLQVLAHPVVLLDPPSGPPGTVVSVSGYGFDPTADRAVVAFANGVPASWTVGEVLPDGSLQATLVYGAGDAGGDNPVVVQELAPPSDPLPPAASRASTLFVGPVSPALTCAATCTLAQVVTVRVLGNLREALTFARAAAVVRFVAPPGGGTASATLGPVTVLDARGDLVGWTAVVVPSGALVPLGRGRPLPLRIDWVPAVTTGPLASPTAKLLEIAGGSSGPLAPGAPAPLCYAGTSGAGSTTCSAALDLSYPASGPLSSAYETTLTVIVA
jgi:hypothetical protein